jgi:hypothetical protein
MALLPEGFWTWRGEDVGRLAMRKRVPERRASRGAAAEPPQRKSCAAKFQGGGASLTGASRIAARGKGEGARAADCQGLLLRLQGRGLRADCVAGAREGDVRRRGGEAPVASPRSRGSGAGAAVPQGLRATQEQLGPGARGGGGRRGARRAGGRREAER